MSRKLIVLQIVDEDTMQVLASNAVLYKCKDPEAYHVYTDVLLQRNKELLDA